MQVIAHSVKILIFGGLLFYLNWKLALASLIAAPLFALASRYFSTRIKAASREKRRRTGTISAVAEESLSNAALVQAYDRQASETKRFHTENLGAFAAQMVATRLRATFGPFIDLLETAAVLLVIGIGIWQLAAGSMTLGGLLVFMAYLAQLYGPIRAFGGLANTAYAASAGAERIIEILDEKPSVTDPVDPAPVRPGPRRAERRERHVHLPRGRRAVADRPALHHRPRAEARRGRRQRRGQDDADQAAAALLRPRPRAGSCSTASTCASSRSPTCAATSPPVLQETLVFDGTVRDNILWGRPEARERDVVAAAVAADAHEFISALPDGYDTRIGQRGRMLSGGQRQRLAIARAMIRNAPVLLLDEPTTGLDAGSTERVLTPLRRLMSGRTSLIISHNLLTVTDADQILFLEQGRITAAGTHVAAAVDVAGLRAAATGCTRGRATRGRRSARDRTCSRTRSRGPRRRIARVRPRPASAAGRGRHGQDAAAAAGAGMSAPDDHAQSRRPVVENDAAVAADDEAPPPLEPGAEVAPGYTWPPSCAAARTSTPTRRGASPGTATASSRPLAPTARATRRCGAS